VHKIILASLLEAQPDPSPLLNKTALTPEIEDSILHNSYIDFTLEVISYQRTGLKLIRPVLAKGIKLQIILDLKPDSLIHTYTPESPVKPKSIHSCVYTDYMLSLHVLHLPYHILHKAPQQEHAHEYKSLLSALFGLYVCVNSHCLSLTEILPPVGVVIQFSPPLVL